jgi:cation-transporting P-type ATPase D
VAGVLGLRDTLRAGAAAAVGALAALGGRQPVLITGDNHCAAAHLAEQVGIAEVHAGLLPEHKVEIVRGLPGRVLVVGDGVNDAPAMAAAHTSIAMGGRGADLTLQTADAIIIADELNAIPAVVALARRARRTMLANLAIAATFIAVLVVWDLFWYLPLPLGVAGHEGSTILVALNGLRLLRNRAWLAW